MAAARPENPCRTIHTTVTARLPRLSPRGRGYGKRRGAPQDFERSLRLLERTLDGATLQECGKEFGMTFGRVSKLVRWMVKELLSAERLLSETPPPHSYSTSGRRRHPEFWRRQIQKARQPKALTAAEPPDLQYALDECVMLLNYYAELANRHDGGQRRTFTVESWLGLLAQLRLAGEPEAARADACP